MKTFFVSSTFRDMDEERDAIQQITLPRLNAVARTYDESVSFCDLRWGVDTSTLESDKGSQKVLDVCLDEIDRCRPPMVVILGYRYGWLPPEGLIKEAARRRRLSLDSLEKSITALEIEYGALPEAANSNTLFYFREFDGDIPEHCASEDAEHDKLLKQLKDRIMHLNGGHVKNYRVRWNGQNLEGIRDFAEMLAEDLETLMLPGWKQNSTLSPREKELRTHREYLREKASMFYARSAFAEKLVEKIKDGETRLLIKDVAGSGKSTFFSHLALRLEEEGFTVFPLFSALTSGSSTAGDILKKIVFFLEESLGVSHLLETRDGETVTEKKARQRLSELCQLCRENTNLRIVIMVDAIDQLLPDELRDNLYFVPQELSGSLRLVLTCLKTFPTKGILSHSFPPFEQGEKEDMIRAILSAHHRELSEPVVSAMASLQQSENPLYVSLLIQRMLMMDRQDFDRIRSLGDGMDAITAYQLELLKSCPEELDRLCVMLLNVAGERINPRLVSRASKFLALSRYGLRLEDLQGLLGEDFNMLDFSHFMTYMSDSFILRNDGRYDFSHRSIREGYLETCDDKQELREELIRYFSFLEESDPLRRTELVYQMYLNKVGKELISYIDQYEGHKDQGIIRAAAATLFELFRIDGHSDLWFIYFVTSPEACGTRNTVRFLVWKLRQESTSYNLDTIITANALQSAITLAERLKTQGVEVDQDYAKALYLHPDYLARIRGQEDQHRRFVLTYLLSLHIFHKLRVEHPTSRARMDEARVCEALSGAYNHLGNQVRAFQYIDKAISLATEDLEEKETRSSLLFLSDCYAKRADFCSFIQAGNSYAFHAQALTDQEKNLDCLRRLSESYPQEDNRRAYCIAYQNVGDTLTEIGGFQNRANLTKALKYYQKAYDLADALHRENHDLGSCRRLAICCRNVSEILTASDRKKYSKVILQFLSKEQELRGHILFSELGSQSATQLARVYALRGRHRLLCDTSPDSLEKAAKDLKMAICTFRGAQTGRLTAPDLERINDIEEILQKKQDSLARNLTGPYYDLSDALRKLGRTQEAEAVRLNAEKLHHMHMSGEQIYAYAELLEILHFMEERYSQAIPYSILDTFRTFRDRQYKQHLDPSIPLTEQNISRKTSALIATLTTNYWVDQKQEEELTTILADNQKRYERDLDLMDVQTLLEEGNSCVESNPNRTFSCYSRAAEMGSEQASFQLALCHWKGTGTPADFEKSIEMFKDLAEKGSPEISIKAATYLGSLLVNNHFFDDGLPWLFKAAKQKDREACKRLGQVYREGEGVLPDREQAIYWRWKAWRKNTNK